METHAPSGKGRCGHPECHRPHAGCSLPRVHHSPAAVEERVGASVHPLSLRVEAVDDPVVDAVLPAEVDFKPLTDGVGGGLKATGCIVHPDAVHSLRCGIRFGRRRCRLAVRDVHRSRVHLNFLDSDQLDRRALNSGISSVDASRADVAERRIDEVVLARCRLQTVRAKHLIGGVQ